MLNKKHNLKSGKKTKIRKKGLERKNKTGNKKNILMKTKLQFSVLMLFLS